MTSFRSELKQIIETSLYNNYGILNYDVHRFGAYQPRVTSFSTRLKTIVKRAIGYRKNELSEHYLAQISQMEGLEKMWSTLNRKDRELMVSLIAYRLLGYHRVKLPTNNQNYWNALKEAEKLADPNDKYDPEFMHFKLDKLNLKPLGYDISLYIAPIGAAIEFIIEQYAYKNQNKTLVSVEDGDVVLDIGGCWGDTALYFAHKAGSKGKVYSFEFIPNNIKLHNINTRFNTELDKSIELIPFPVSDKSNVEVYFKDNGPASQLKESPFQGQTGSTRTISIDDFVVQEQLSKVDFIKMDIEGAEPYALKGALNTIRKFRPKLAIAIYHSMDDFVNIPNWILDLQLDYELYLGHYTIHAEETIIFAKPRNT